MSGIDQVQLGHYDGAKVPEKKVLNEEYITRPYTLYLEDLGLGKGETSKFNLQRLLENGSVKAGNITISTTPEGAYVISRSGKPLKTLTEVTFLSQLKHDGELVGLMVSELQDDVVAFRERHLKDKLDFFDDDELAA